MLNRFAAALAIMTAASSRTATAQGTDATAAPKGPAIYTAEQAERGSRVFGYRCITCHQRTDYANPDFRLKWNGQTAYSLFERIRSSMPDTDPGSYGINEYQDVVAYILKLNGLPAGTAPFVGDSVAKATVLDFSLYKAVPTHHTEVVHALPQIPRVALHGCCSARAAERATRGGDPARH